MAQITAAVVRELRDKTGAGMMDCKKALSASEGDLDKAVDFLRTKGLSAAAKKAGRATDEGLVFSYIHPGGRVGVLLEINCESDFVARTDDFQDLCKDIAMHVAAVAPTSVRRDEFDAALLEHEKEIFKAQAIESGKPAEIAEKMVAGRIEKLFVDFTGTIVKKGEHLVSMYSPDLLSTQKEYLLAYSGIEQSRKSGIPDVISSAKSMLE